MNTSESQHNSPAVACRRRCHLCPHSYSHTLRYGTSTYTLGQHCRLYGDVPLDAIPWRREQNRAYDQATLSLAGAPLPCRLAAPASDDGDDP